jgi:hypothetical protein
MAKNPVYVDAGLLQNHMVHQVPLEDSRLRKNLKDQVAILVVGPYAIDDRVDIGVPQGGFFEALSCLQHCCPRVRAVV